jgi:hypothetical protein
MSAIPTIPSSASQYLSCVAERLCRAGPNTLLQMMVQLTGASSAAMIVFERFGAATLPPPSRPAPACIIVDISSRFQPTVRQ